MVVPVAAVAAVMTTAAMIAAIVITVVNVVTATVVNVRVVTLNVVIAALTFKRAQWNEAVAFLRYFLDTAQGHTINCKTKINFRVKSLKNENLNFL